MNNIEFKNYIINQIDKIKELNTGESKTVVNILQDTYNETLRYNPTEFRTELQKKIFENGKKTYLENIQFNIEALEKDYSINKSSNFLQAKFTLAEIITYLKD